MTDSADAGQGDGTLARLAPWRDGSVRGVAGSSSDAGAGCTPTDRDHRRRHRSLHQGAAPGDTHRHSHIGRDDSARSFFARSTSRRRDTRSSPGSQARTDIVPPPRLSYSRLADRGDGACPSAAAPRTEDCCLSPGFTHGSRCGLRGGAIRPTIPVVLAGLPRFRTVRRGRPGRTDHECGIGSPAHPHRATRS